MTDAPDRSTSSARPEPSGTALLAVRDLRVRFRTDGGTVEAVRGVDLDLAPGEILGIVGESGSGKSTVAMSLTGLNRSRSCAIEGEVRYRGRDLLALPERDLRPIRGAEIAMIFQDPMTSLTPVHRVGDLIAEVIRAHEPIGRRAARARAIEALDEVGIPDPKRRAHDYPHQFSGGMRQRVMIAMALACRPSVLIADEPTTALDVTTQAQILRLIRRLRVEHGTAVLLITHDLGVVAQVADRVAVMHRGHWVEEGPVERLLTAPEHAYTRGLLEAIPRVDRPRVARLATISVGDGGAVEEPAGDEAGEAGATGAGTGEILAAADGGKATAAAGDEEREIDASADETRPTAGAADTRDEPARELGPDRSVSGPVPQVDGPADGTIATPLAATGSTGGEPLLRLRGVEKTYRIDGHDVPAVAGVDLDVHAGETLGLVGESGSGKSTLARCIIGLRPLTGGTISFDGRDLATLGRRALHTVRRDVTMVFQDPFASLNPNRRVIDVVAAPLDIHRIASGAERRRRVETMLDRVGLTAAHADRYPHEFSGGQRQRIGIARALITGPRLVVCDEPVSALDVSVQAQILNLLADLQQELGLTMLFISHDLGVIRHVSRRIAVMYHGEIVEQAGVDELFAAPSHPYTRALLAAVPSPDPATRVSDAELLADDARAAIVG